MLRPILTILTVVTIAMPSLLYASSHEELFKSVILANQQTQPDLHNYTVTVETSRIAEVMTQMTKGIPDNVAPPPTPVIKKFWQRAGNGIIYAEQADQVPYVVKTMEQVSAYLAVELNAMLLPADKSELRKTLLTNAEVKTSEVSLAETSIRRVVITFSQPTDIKEAFYVEGMRLPQKEILSLTFDIDTKRDVISELTISTNSGLHLTVEIRYIAVPGGYTPERFKVTSPDGNIDDLFEVKFLELEGFHLPASMLRKFHRPNLDETLEVFFKNYQINRPVSDEMKARLTAGDRSE